VRRRAPSKSSFDTNCDAPKRRAAQLPEELKSFKGQQRPATLLAERLDSLNRRLRAKLDSDSASIITRRRSSKNYTIRYDMVSRDGVSLPLSFSLSLSLSLSL